MDNADLDSGFCGRDDLKRQDLGCILDKNLIELVDGSGWGKGKGRKSRIVPSLGL